MICSNCGKDVPFGGNVCPYCGAEKSGDQATYVLAVIGGVIGGVIGFVSYKAPGAVIGFLVGIFAVMIFRAMNKKK